MEPTRLDELRELSLNAKITVPGVLTPEFDVSRTMTKTDIALEALYEGTARPSWNFRQTPRFPLRGLMRLRFIARAPGAIAARGELSVGATVSAERFGLRSLSYTVPLGASAEALRFDLQHGTS